MLTIADPSAVLCRCGCGRPISRPGWRYLRGHKASPGRPLPPPINPSGLCQCGCGQPAPIATHTSAARGWIKGRPLRYISGHNGASGRLPSNPERSKPSLDGLCGCGCGGVTPIATQNRPLLGHKEGMHTPFLRGHGTRRFHRQWVEEDRGYVTPCHIWQGPFSRGYGKDGRKMAHVAVYEKAHGPVPPELELDHLCRQRPCVRLDHLEAVTPKVNNRRKASTILTEDDVRYIKAHLPYTPQAELARQFNVDHTTISRIKRGLIWQDIS